MKAKKSKTDKSQPIDAENVWKTGWTLIRSVVDTAREPFLILDEDLKVLAANEAYYRTFQSLTSEVEGHYIYALGNGQWDQPVLKRLLEEILPKKTFFENLEIEHNYPNIGKKIILMNAREVFEHQVFTQQQKLIILSMEDVTKQRELEEQLAAYSKDLENRVLEKTKSLVNRITALEKAVNKK